MPTPQKLQQKQTKATQKVGGSANPKPKKPAVTKAMEGGSAKKPVTKVVGGGKAAPSKGKTPRGGSAKGGGIGNTMKKLLPGKKEVRNNNTTNNDITNLWTEINELKKNVTNIMSVIAKINIETLNKVQFDIKAIIDAVDYNTKNKIYENQQNHVKIQNEYNNDGKPVTYNEYGMPNSIYDEMFPSIYEVRW
jgi:hypothetical protein